MRLEPALYSRGLTSITVANDQMKIETSGVSQRIS